MFKKIVFSLISVFLLLAPALVRADGGIMPRPDYSAYETGQKAAIVYQDKIETLVLSTSFAGNAKDFAYIVPTPTKPEVSKISDDIFTNLANLTEENNIIQPMTDSLGAPRAAVQEGVTVVEKKQVGLYEVTVLSAIDSNSLFTWLTENNFTYPANKKYILDDYIKNNWFFTTAKISIEAITKDIKSKLASGELTPLKFVFQTDNMVFPLKISAVTDEASMKKDYEAVQSNMSEAEISSKMIYPIDSVPITLYVFADHKKSLSSDNYSITYANWINKNEIGKLAKDDNGNPWVNVSAKKMFLTKFSANLSYSAMTDDAFFDDAENNDKVGVASWWENLINKSDSSSVLNIMFIYIGAFFVFLLLCFIQFTSRSKTVYIVSWIVQSICLAAYFFLLVVMVAMFSTGFISLTTNLDLAPIAIVISIPTILVIVGMIIIMILEGVKQKKIKEGK